MTSEDRLAEVFGTLEHTAPDADGEFTALRARLDGLARRRVRRNAFGGLAVTGVTAAVACLATYLPADSTPHPNRAGSAPPTASARPGRTTPTPLPRVQQVAFSKSVATTTDADGVERPIVTVDAGWLPRGASVTDVSADTARNGGGSERRWLVPYPRDGLGGYYVSVQRSSDHELPRYEILKTTGRDLTVQGRPARMFDVHWGRAVHQVILAVDFGQGRIYEAGTFYEVQKLSPATAAAVTEHVARDMTVDRHDVLPVTARLTAAPSGAQIVDAYAVFDDTVYNDHFTMTYYRLDDEDSGAQIGIGGLAEKYPAPISTGTAGRDVQGRPTVVIKDKGHTILYVKGLFGKYTKIISGKGAETLADLYQIADGIRAVT